VPLSVILCGLPGASSATINEPVRVPSTMGVNVTLTAQLPPAGSVEQPPLLAKSPVVVIPEITRGVVLRLVSVTDWGALVAPTGWSGKFTGVVPVKLTACGLPGASSLINTAP
jgi:hypothetical protein